VGEWKQGGGGLKDKNIEMQGGGQYVQYEKTEGTEVEGLARRGTQGG